MGDGLYSDTLVCLPHASWVVRQYVYPMGDGSYSDTLTPCIMSRTVVHLPHG